MFRNVLRSPSPVWRQVANLLPARDRGFKSLPQRFFLILIVSLYPITKTYLFTFKQKSLGYKMKTNVKKGTSSHNQRQQGFNQEPKSDEHGPLAKISEMASKKMATWLKEGLIKWYGPSPQDQLKAFGKYYYFVSSWCFDSVTAALGSVYTNLNDQGKKKFRKAILKAFVSLSPHTTEKTKAMRTLMFLMGMLDIKEGVKIIANKILDNEELFNLGVDTIVGLSRNNADAGDVLRQIVESKNFSYHIAPCVFIGLCSSKPSKIIDHLKILRKAFTKLHTKEKGEINNAYISAIRLTHIVGVKNIAKNLPEFSINDPNQCSLNDDSWLIEALFFMQESPLHLESDDNNLYISKKGEEGRFSLTFSNDQTTVQQYLINHLNREKKNA